jgi:hypothetical protein
MMAIDCIEQKECKHKAQSIHFAFYTMAEVFVSMASERERQDDM